MQLDALYLRSGRFPLDWRSRHSQVRTVFTRDAGKKLRAAA